MKCLDVCPKEAYPRIMGLTASVINKKCESPKELEESLIKLETTLQCTAETATDMLTADVYTARPKETILQYKDYQDETGLVVEISDIIEAAINFITDANIQGNKDEKEKDPKDIPLIVLREIESILYTLGPWCAMKVAQTMYKQVQNYVEHEVQQWPRYFLQYVLTQIRLISFIVEKKFDTEVMSLEDFHQYISPKVLRLVEILHDYKPDDNFVIVGGDDFMESGDLSDEDDSLNLSDQPDSDVETEMKDTKHNYQYVAIKRKENSDGTQKTEDEEEEKKLCGVIFVERRHAAFALNKLIQELCIWDPDLFFIQSHHITGHGAGRGGGENKEAMMIHKKQEEILQRFRQKDINLLVATSVLEEGVDVPKCNLVVRFDLPKEYRSYVQSKVNTNSATVTYKIR